MGDEKTLFAVLLCAVASLALVLKWRRNKSRPPYPPGPKGYLLIGNILDVPQNIPIWQAFIPLARKFDTDVLYLKLFTTDFIVLNSTEAITDLLEKQSKIYSDRMSPPLRSMDVYSWDFALNGYGSRWRRCRKLFHEFLNVNAVSRFDNYLDKHTRRFLSRLAETPDNFLDHTQFVTGALVMEMTYGMDIKSHEDKFLQAAERAMGHLESAVVPGAFLVDTFPILKHVPDWFPGAGFKQFAKAGRDLFDVAVNGPLNYVKESLKANGSNVSIAASCFDRVAELADQGFDESVVRAVTATMYIVLRTFFLVAALHPHVVRKAQEELDRVVGGERLPQLSGQEDLPYISALIKELLRWCCPAPFGVPKRVTEDNIYKGYFIPAGATIIENIWAICYDGTVYPAPHTYDPERFLKDGKLDRSIKDPEDMVFGTGRRICPGRWFALRTLFLNIACTLAIFDIEAPAGEKLEPKFHESHVRHAIPFKCVIKPRSEAKLKLIRDSDVTAGLN
ncbi:cytochrome P450 [Thelephora ganbajun]|uniref:Cytochrome P450 n=1 Tax=Thelephora ganbajun TaxID=370292 RepID=A0ACB6Z958_THEGA|nr:cytochrome P450 [Thelephora ganbajun]